MLEKLSQRLSRCPIEAHRVQRRPHMVQPGAALCGANLEPRVRLPQAQPPSALGLLFITAQELDEKGGKLLGGASQALAREERTEDRVLADSRVECRR